MADQVQAALDQMVAPLKDLLDRGIFSEEEVRSIVSRRREHEYLLRRRAARKADFLRYIETEMALEKLRALRSRQALFKQKALMKDHQDDDDDNKNHHDKKKKQQKPIGDVHIVQHVHLLFVRAIRKFKSDVTLYLQHAAFCKQVKSFSRLTRIYAEAVQIHPKNVGLWIEAASNEFFGVVVEEESAGGRVNNQVVHGGGSVQNARIILQRGLRINPKSQELWLQTFGLELHYIQKLRGRQAIMFANPPSDAESEPSSKQQSQATTTISTTIPLLVFKNAIRAIPDDLTFRLKFVDLCQMFPRDSVGELHQHIMDTIRDNFKSEPFAWVAWAAHVAKTKMAPADNDAVGFLVRNAEDGINEGEDDGPPQKRSRSDSTTSEKPERKASSSSDSDPVLEVLKEATETIPTPEMLLLSVQFSENYAASLVEDTTCESDTEKKQDLLENLAPTIKSVNFFVQQLFDRAERLGIQSPELLLEQVNYILSMDREQPRASAMKVIESYCTRNKAQVAITTDSTKVIPSAVWIRWAELHIASDSSSQANVVMPEKALEVLRMGLKHTPMTASEQYMKLMLHLINGLIMIISASDESNDAESATHDDELARLFQQMLILAPGQIDSKPADQEIQYSEFFGPCSISQTCFKYLSLQNEKKGVQGARKVFHRVLFQHQLPPTNWVAHDTEGWKAFIDECIHIESTTGQMEHALLKKKMRQHLDRLYQLATTLFRETKFGDYFKQQREDKLIAQN